MPRPLRLVRTLVVTCLLAVACSSEGASPPAGPAGSDRPGGESPGGPGATLPGVPEGADALAGLPGRLAIIDGAGLVLVDPTGVNAETVDSADMVGQPTWAPNGTAIAWTREANGEAEVRVRPVLTAEPDENDPVAGEGAIELTGGPAVYLQWNPMASSLGFLEAFVSEGEGSDGTGSGIALSVATVDEAGPGPATRLLSGPSLYFSWAGDGAGIVAHRGDEVLVRSLDSVGTDPIPAEPLFRSGGWFRTPDWLGAGEALVAGDRTLLSLDVETGATSLLAEIAGPTEFVLNGPGSHVAFLQPGAAVQTIQAPTAEAEAGPGTGSDALQVLDVETGATALVGLSDGTPVTPVAWEWSPDGSIISFLAPSELQPELFRWYFWQLAPGGGHLVGATTGFNPSEVMRQTHLPFFSQYAHSATGWSPDTAAYAFAGSIDGVEGVFVHVLGRTPQSIHVGSGQYVTWSPQNVQVGGRSVL